MALKFGEEQAVQNAYENGHQFDRYRSFGHDGLFPNCRTP